MPGRFREGTETCIRKVRTLETLPTCRQTQNPERGRKLEIQHHIRSCGMLPKSSDPKPREGTETPRGWRMRCARKCRQTQNPERGRKLNNTFFERGAVESVVRPKTPRGDGNAYRPPHHSHATAPCPQTQNPERGRKLVRHLCLIQVQCPVVRPKTPRGDGNTETQHQPDNLILASSDPKPREGTETRRWPVNRRG
ncbi:Uncharacterised protein [Mycobacterium tuberculosis]|nr:Uncharacterised protein [Mycobacterium tuberculosis]